MGKGRTIWFQIEKGEHEEAIILNLPVLYWKDIRIFLDVLSQDDNWVEQTPQRDSYQLISSIKCKLLGLISFTSSLGLCIYSRHDIACY